MFYLSMGWKEQEAILPSVEEHSYTALISLKSLEQLIYRISQNVYNKDNYSEEEQTLLTKDHKEFLEKTNVEKFEKVMNQAFKAVGVKLKVVEKV